MNGTTKKLSAYWSECKLGIGADKMLYWFIFAYAAIAVVFVASRSELSPDTLTSYAGVWALNYLVIFPMLVWIIGYVRITLRLDKRRSLAYRHMFSTQRMGRFLAGTALFLGLLIFVTSFTSIKNAISTGNGFGWDVTLANFDRAMHFGADPWRYLHAIGNNRFVLAAAEFNYNVLWFVLNYGILYWVAISPRADKIRIRYLTCFFLTWIILGSLFAGLFISAGPAFYGQVTGDTARFGEQLAFLSLTQGTGNSALDYQNYLWAAYQAGKASIGSGISAFPSVHVGFVAINALFAFEYGRKLGLAALGYVLVTLLSSVYLAWHYAIDGYFSILVVVAIYFGVKTAMANRWRWGLNPVVNNTDEGIRQLIDK